MAAAKQAQQRLFQFLLDGAHGLVAGQAQLFAGFEALAILAYLFPSVLIYSFLSSLLGAAICGLAFIYSMAHVYMQRTLLTWNTHRTLWSFFLTTVSLGLLITALAMTAQSPIYDTWVHSTALLFSRSAAGLIAVQVTIHFLARWRALPQTGEQRQYWPACCPRPA